VNRDPQVHLVPQEKPVLKDHPVKKVIQERQVQWDLQVSKDYQGQLVQKVQKVHQVKPEILDHQVHRENRVMKECKVNLE
jgi:hypothetical protein